MGSPSVLDWLVLAVVVVTLALMLTRPRGVPEAWFALAGAVAMLALRAVPVRAVPRLVDQTSGVLLFLLGMMVATGIVERAGLFALLAESCVRLARGNGVRLFVFIFLLGAIVTATLSLDVTVIMLTPIVYALAARRRLDALPFMFACTFVANTASLVFPVSNLTNLLVYNRLGISFATFTAVMWLPNLVAVGVNLAIFLWLFRDRLPRAIPAAAELDAKSEAGWLWLTGAVLIVTLAALFTLGLLGRPLWWASLAGGAVLLLAAIATRRIGWRQLGDDVSVPLFVFVVSMVIVVAGVERTWFDRVTLPFPAPVLPALALGLGAGAIGSNIVNNVPMTVLALSWLQRSPAESLQPLAFGTLLGTNIGPALTTYGSLATMLWLSLVRRHGMDISTRAYMRVSLLTIPPVLLAAGLTLWLVLAVLR